MKHILSLSILSLLIFFFARPALADSGQWRVHPVFSRPVSRAVETSSDVYYLAGGSLFGYDKKRDESVSYTADNFLSSSADITDLFYDHAADRLLLAYEDGNIDILYGSREPEKVVNLPDIAASTVMTGKGINDMAFDGDTAYVATAFGMVKLNIASAETLSSGIYGKPVQAVTLTPSHVIFKYDGKICSMPRGARPGDMDAMTRLTSWSDVTEMATLTPNLVIVNNKGTLYLLRLNDAATTISPAQLATGLPASKAFITAPDGALRLVSSSKLYEMDTDGKLNLLAPLHDDLKTDAIACGYGPSAIWGAGHKGIACYGYDGNGGWTLLSDRYLPEALSVKRVSFITPSADGERVYFSNQGPTVFRLGYVAGNEGLTVVHTATLMDADGKMTDVTAFPVEAKYSLTASNQKGYGAYPLAPTQMVEDPDDPSTYWLGTGNDGLYRITSGALTGRFDQDNAPFAAPWGCRVYSVSIDRGGNLWVITHPDAGHSGIAVLPAAKRRLSSEEITADDWIELTIPGFSANKDVSILHCRKSNMVFILDASTDRFMLAIDTRGTFDDLSDDIYRVWDSLIDQDGKTFSPDRQSALAEDLGGRVWIGTSGGVIELPNPSEAATQSLTVTHVKVPRRDGTNAADYLLESDIVYSIAVDHADRKWLATEGSGAFLVSPRGDEIIQTFNASNSPLSSNRVNAVYCSPRSNAVYFGTDRGVVEYASSASPAAPSFDDINVYPNPVRPEHSGPVTITGLMDGSLVKIANAAGHVIWQGRSEGGMCTWPVTDMGGRRVRSGVYFIMASRSGQDVDSAGAVARVTVVN
ncbi:MAG: hypothetical protein NC342_05365 [Pseudoflavonifractor sp.]|nr:hypothetical protein [Alloprevotella sp.]MCM1116946.1 hypothetical protein [Pseudoflavonifractor sp.]